MSTIITEFVVVDANGKFRLAECSFATLRDLDEIKAWPRQVKGAHDPVTQDALEFALLSSKRWHFIQAMRVATISEHLKQLETVDDSQLLTGYRFLVTSRRKGLGTGASFKKMVAAKGAKKRKASAGYRKTTAKPVHKAR